VGQATGDVIISRLHFACWVTMAADTHSEYVILIAFPRQQWLCERALLLCLDVPCLSCVTRMKCRVAKQTGLMAARSNVWVCGRPPAGIAGSNLTGIMDVCLL